MPIYSKSVVEQRLPSFPNACNSENVPVDVPSADYDRDGRLDVVVELASTLYSLFPRPGVMYPSTHLISPYTRGVPALSPMPTLHPLFRMCNRCPLALRSPTLARRFPHI